MERKLTTKTIVITGMFAAVIAVLAQIAIPMPSGVPITLQTFAIALTGAILGSRLGTAATGIYILLGAVGVPVFSNFTGGLAIIAGKTGGFIWGFLFLALLCGAGATLKNKPLGVATGLLGLIACHLLGTLQFSLLTGMNFPESALLVSVPYLPKDILSLILAYALGLQIRKKLLRLFLFHCAPRPTGLSHYRRPTPAHPQEITFIKLTKSDILKNITGFCQPPHPEWVKE